jgi:hypothetical protein
MAAERDVSKTYLGAGAYRSASTLSTQARKVILRQMKSARTHRISQRTFAVDSKGTTIRGGVEVGEPRASSPQQRAAERMKREGSSEEAQQAFDSLPTRPSTKVKNLHFGHGVTPAHERLIDMGAAKTTLKHPVAVHTGEHIDDSGIVGNHAAAITLMGHGQKTHVAIPTREMARSKAGRKAKAQSDTIDTVAHEVWHAGAGKKRRLVNMGLRRMPNRSRAAEEGGADANSRVTRNSRRVGGDYPLMFAGTGDNAAYQQAGVGRTGHTTRRSRSNWAGYVKAQHKTKGDINADDKKFAAKYRESKSGGMRNLAMRAIEHKNDRRLALVAMRGERPKRRYVAGSDGPEMTSNLPKKRTVPGGGTVWASVKQPVQQIPERGDRAGVRGRRVASFKEEPVTKLFRPNMFHPRIRLTPLTPRYIRRARGKRAGQKVNFWLRKKRGGKKTAPTPTPPPPPATPWYKTGKFKLAAAGGAGVGVVGGTMGYRKAKKEQEQYEEPVTKAYVNYPLMLLTPDLEPVDKSLKRHARKWLKEITTSGVSHETSKKRKKG